MKVLGISWVGVKTPAYHSMKEMFGEILSLQPSYTENDFAVFRLANGDQIEIFGASGPDTQHQFKDGSVVAGIRVDNIEEASRYLQSLGI